MFSHDEQQTVTVTAPTGRLRTETTARTEVRICNSYDCLASLGVVHPVQNDLRCPVPTGHHVARHLGVSAASQAEVQDLHRRQRNRSQSGTSTLDITVHFLYIGNFTAYILHSITSVFVLAVAAALSFKFYVFQV